MSRAETSAVFTNSYSEFTDFAPRVTEFTSTFTNSLSNFPRDLTKTLTKSLTNSLTDFSGNTSSTPL